MKPKRLRKRSFRKIFKNYFEFFAADHCVLKCWQCANFSNLNDPKTPALDTFYKDLNALAKIMHVRCFRFCGGEPLLNRGIVKFIKIARDIKFADYIGICTNGIQLKDADDELFRLIDRLDVSLYPYSSYDNFKIKRNSIVRFAKMKKREHKFELGFYDFSSFSSWRYAYVDLPINNPPLVKRIYAACAKAHYFMADGCHTIYDGYYYKCAMPVYLRRYLLKRRICRKRIPDYRRIDGVALHRPGLYNRLTDYLKSPVPLRSCDHCLGTFGKVIPVNQTSKKALKDSKTKKINIIEDTLDISRLRELEKEAPVARRIALEQMGILKRLKGD